MDNLALHGDEIDGDDGGDSGDEADAESSSSADGKEARNDSSLDSELDALTIHQGSPVTDRKSTFQAHVAPVDTAEQVCFIYIF